MNKILKRTLIGFAAATALCVAAGGYFALKLFDPGLPQNLAVLGPVRLTNEAGLPVRLSETVLPRYATLVAFWATWCAPCRKEAVEIAALRRKYRASDLSILYLNVDDVPNATATSAFLRASHAENLRVFYAGHSGWKSITGSSSMALPRSYIFDRKGMATAVFSGFDESDSKSEMERSLTKALAS